MAIFGLPALVQFIGLIAVFVSMSLVDRMGRRPVLLIGIGIMVTAGAVMVITFLFGASGQDPTDVQLNGGAGVFAILGGFAILAFLFVLKFAPETKGRPLDDISMYWENGGKWPAEPAGTGAGAQS